MTITLTREEAQQVLDVLNDVRYRIEFGQMNLSDDTDAAIETLRARLAQPEPEPVAWMFTVLKLDSDTDTVEKRVLFRDFDSGQGVPLYTAPPQREWQGLTDEERLRCFDDVDWNKVDWCPDHEQYAKAIEALLKEKNA
jgi:hypothetical protein